MDVSQQRYYVGDNAGRHADSMASHGTACSLGVGGLVLLFIFLAIIAWAVHSGHDRTRDTIGHGNALLLASRQDNTALAVAFARDQGRNDAVTAAILARVDMNGERLCGLSREVQGEANRIVNHGDTWGFQSFRREPCCGGHDRGNDRGNGTTIDFNSGVQTLTALGSVLGRSNQGAGS